MSKHTPGPWAVSGGRVITTSSGQFYLSYGKDKYGNPLFKDFVELDNNAHLIAAAPAMYAESKTLCSLVRAFMNDNRLYDGQLIQAIHNLETALAQAEGSKP